MRLWLTGALMGHPRSAVSALRGTSGPAIGERVRDGLVDRLGDATLKWLCTAAAALVVATLVAIAYEVFSGATEAISHFGLGFLGHAEWAPEFNRMGAGALVYGTLVTSFGAILLAAPLGVSIGLYLSTVASGRVRATIGPLVEMLAAIPSVILGFWGILVLAPFLRDHVEGFLHGTLGFVPLFGEIGTTGTGLFIAILLLTIMVVPIVASISRDLFLTVPGELTDGATALGATRWEVIRGVMLPSTGAGLVAAVFLGLALGEAIAVMQVVGAGNAIHASLFETGDTLASRIAEQYQGAATALQHSSLFYLGAILLVIALLTNIAAQRITRMSTASLFALAGR
jgi:phosphate transport system permease protein